MLVARMLLGSNADRLGIETSTFNDVAVTRWSAPAIEYCVSPGLIDGTGDAYYITTTLAKEQRISDEQLTNSNDYTVEFGEHYFPNLRLIREADEFERPSHTWTYNGDEIGSYTDYELQVATYTEAITGRELYDLLGKSTIEEYSITYYVDGAVNDNIKASNMIRTNTVKYNTTGNGVLTQVFVDHDDEEITITSVNTYLAVANADYNETRGELSLTVYQSNAVGTGKTVDVEDIAHITDYKEGDFMLVNMAAIGTTGDKMEVVRVNDVESMVDCTVTSYSTGKTVTVDGTDYDYAEKAYYDDGVLDEYSQGYLADYAYTFYMDQYGYVICTEIYEREANYVYITGYNLTGSNLPVKTCVAGNTRYTTDVTLSDTPDAADAYRIVISKLGIDGVVYGSGTTLSLTGAIVVNSDIIVTDADGEIIPIALPTIEDVEWTGNSITIYFSKTVDVDSAALAESTFADDDADFEDISETASDVTQITYNINNGQIAVGDKFTITPANITSHQYGGQLDTNGDTTIELTAGGYPLK